jgi:hypothetical protein
MKNQLLYLFCLFTFTIAQAQLEKKYLNNDTYEYDELIEAYKLLGSQGSRGELIEVGESDFGKPIYVFMIAPESFSTIRESKELREPSVLINNAIHPGESCGVDASLHLAEDILSGKIESKVWVCIVPAYNVGGMHNRRSNTRANQQGPRSQGFRGNANNYDLNRDFTKADTKNTQSFYEIFETIKPQFFIDNHTTNGADYQYEQTLIFSPKEKFPQSLKADAEDFRNTLFKELKKKKVVAGNFVNIYGTTPDKGFAAFHETPIYSTGYTALFNTFGIVSETHMFKTYKRRVEATYALSKTVIEYANEKGISIKEKMDLEEQTILTTLPIQWEIDSTKKEELKFLGFRYEYQTSEVTGGQRLKYLDKKKTYTIDYYPSHKPKVEVTVPDYYVVPKSWNKVLHRLNVNFIETTELEQKDYTVEAYRIKSYETSRSVYEGHFRHSKIEVDAFKKEIAIDERYVLVPTDQRGTKLIVHLLEPQAEGSLFSWNFFDPILQQKEWYSDYVFEDTAKKLLEEDSELKGKFEALKKEDPEFANNPRAQLYFIYINSSYYEPTHNLYPVYRLLPP